MEAPVELDVRARGAAALELGLAPALRPQERGREEVAAQLRGLRPGRPLHLHPQQVEQRVEARGAPPPAPSAACRPAPRTASAASRTATRRRSARRSRGRRSARSNWCTCPFAISVSVCGPNSTGAAVDQVPAGALAHPDQLVVGVPVRLANVVALDAIELERTHLQRVGFGGQIVDRGLSHLAHCRESAHEPRCLPPRAPAFRPVAGASAGPFDGPSGRRAAVGEARRLQQRPRLRRQQDAQARVPGGGRARRRAATRSSRSAASSRTTRGRWRRWPRASGSAACSCRRAGSTGRT